MQGVESVVEKTLHLEKLVQSEKVVHRECF